MVKYSALSLLNISVEEDPTVKAEYDLELVCLLIQCLFFFVDNVPFGEVAMAPPSFSSKPRKALVKSQVTCASVITHYVGDLRGLSKKFTCFFITLLPSLSRMHQRSCSSTPSSATLCPPQPSPPWPDRGSWRRRG